MVDLTAQVLAAWHDGKGTTLFMSQWVIHRSSRYFPDPEAFMPDRWADGLAKRLPKYAYFPFGGGPRICIGGGSPTLGTGLPPASPAPPIPPRLLALAP